MTAVAFVLKGYPRLSETFIAQEIHALERRGLDLRLYSLRAPTDRAHHPIHDEIRAPVAYLPEYLYREPARVWRAWRAARRRPGYAEARRQWLADLRRDPTPNRVRRFGQALVLAHELTPDVGWIHAHFLHTPASVARYAAKIVGLPWTASAHAKDVWTTPAWEIREKLADCRWLVTCTGAGRDYLAVLAPTADRVELLYHGIDLERFARPPTSSRNNGATPVILAVGRAVEKKGFDVLIAALGRLSADTAWRFVHIGGGARLDTLKRQAERLDLADRITWLGPQPQTVVLDHLRRADLFVLPSRIGADGDRDGLPNVLLEAQSQGLACVSTSVSAIPELIVDGETGVLVRPDDPEALAAALRRLLGDANLRTRLGRAGEARVRSVFGHDAGLDRLAAKFRSALALRP